MEQKNGVSTPKASLLDKYVSFHFSEPTSDFACLLSGDKNSLQETGFRNSRKVGRTEKLSRLMFAEKISGA